MDWNRVPIEESAVDNSGKPEIESPQASAGLSVTPDSLHEQFLSRLDHLAEAQTLHGDITADQAGEIEARFDQVAGVLHTDALLDLFGGREEEDTLLIPLHGCELSGVSLALGELDGRSVLRLELQTKEGQQLDRLFTLPAGSNLAEAVWTAGELHLNLDRS